MSNLAAAAAALQQKQQNPVPYNVFTDPNQQSPWKTATLEGRKMMKTIGYDLLNERLSQNLTQRQLARKIGMSQAVIHRAETNGCVSLMTLLRIAHGLNKTIKLN